MQKETINCEQKDMVPLTKEEKEDSNNQKVYVYMYKSIYVKVYKYICKSV